MERYAWKATLLPGKKEEYVRRHNEIWQEMKDVLAAAGNRHYTARSACVKQVACRQKAPWSPAGTRICRT